MIALKMEFPYFEKYLHAKMLKKDFCLEKMKKKERKRQREIEWVVATYIGITTITEIIISILVIISIVVKTAGGIDRSLPQTFYLHMKS